MRTAKTTIFILLCLLLTACTPADDTPSATEVSFTLEVLHGDGSTNTFSLTSDAETLGDALLAEELIAGESGAYGLFVQTVDNETADESLQQWWCLTLNGGEVVTTGVDTTPLTADTVYELTLKTGW